MSLVRLLALVMVFALPSVAVAQDDVGDMFDPTSRWELYRFESIPEGAEIEYRGEANYFTDAQFEIDTTYLSTIRLILEGYQPCSFAQGSAKRDKIGLTKSGFRFVCHLVRITGKDDADVNLLEGPTLPVEGGPPLSRGISGSQPG